MTENEEIDYDDAPPPPPGKLRLVKFYCTLLIIREPIMLKKDFEKSIFRAK